MVEREPQIDFLLVQTSIYLQEITKHILLGRYWK